MGPEVKRATPCQQKEKLGKSRTREKIPFAGGERSTQGDIRNPEDICAPFSRGKYRETSPEGNTASLDGNKEDKC